MPRNRINKLIINDVGQHSFEFVLNWDLDKKILPLFINRLAVKEQIVVPRAHYIVGSSRTLTSYIISVFDMLLCNGDANTDFHAHICSHTHTHTLMHAHIHTNTYTHTYTHTHTSTHTHTHAQTLTHAHTQTHTHSRTHAHAHTYTQTHTYTHIYNVYKLTIFDMFVHLSNKGFYLQFFDKNADHFSYCQSKQELHGQQHAIQILIDLLSNFPYRF